jgi:hypothetical protein
VEGGEWRAGFRLDIEKDKLKQKALLIALKTEFYNWSQNIPSTLHPIQFYE